MNGSTSRDPFLSNIRCQVTQTAPTRCSTYAYLCNRNHPAQIAACLPHMHQLGIPSVLYAYPFHNCPPGSNRLTTASSTSWLRVIRSRSRNDQCAGLDYFGHASDATVQQQLEHRDAVSFCCCMKNPIARVEIPSAILI